MLQKADDYREIIQLLTFLLTFPVAMAVSVAAAAGGFQRWRPARYGRHANPTGKPIATPCHIFSVISKQLSS